jgi:hypothetical protein
MSDLGNPELGSEATYFYETHMRAERAFSQRNWILAATLCRTLAELELEAATITGAAHAWNGSTRSVPLLKVPMRDEAPRPADTAVFDSIRPTLET